MKYIHLRNRPAPLNTERERFLTKKLNDNPKVFWMVVSQHYSPVDDGESESETIKLLASDKFLPLYVKIYDNLKKH